MTWTRTIPETTLQAAVAVAVARRCFWPPPALTCAPRGPLTAVPPVVAAGPPQLPLLDGAAAAGAGPAIRCYYGT